MVCDVIRNSYEIDMYFDPECTLKRRVRWYFAAPGAKFFPGGTVFNSSIWGSFGAPGIGAGEDPLSVFKRVKDERPAGLEGKGSHCGPEEWFHDGTPSDAPPVTIVGGRPACCGDPIIQGAIGIQLGIESVPNCVTTTTGKAWFSGDLVDWLPSVSYSGYAHGFQLHWSNPPEIGGFLYLVTGAPSLPVCIAATLVWVYGSFQNSEHLEGPYPVYNYPDVVRFHVNHPAYPYSSRSAYFRFTAPPLLVVLGLKLGIAGSAPSILGRLGLKFGLMAGELSSVPATVGIALGLESTEAATASGDLGLMLGLAGSLEHDEAGTVGVKLGLAGVPSAVETGIVGLLFGLAAAERVTLAGTVGVKLGIAGVSYSGRIVPCCPGVVIPATLHATGSAGTAFTTTYNAGNGGWPFSDPDSLANFVLKCVAVGAGFQWQAVSIQAGCTKTYSVQSLTCSPFSLHCRTVLGGGSCIDAGTYNFTFAP